MARVQDVFGFGVTQLVIGLSSVLFIPPREKQLSMALKYVSGGSLEIFPSPVGATAGTTATGVSWGSGYLMGTTEVFNVQGAPRFYLAATGATAIAHLALGLSDPG